MLRRAMGILAQGRNQAATTSATTAWLRKCSSVPPPGPPASPTRHNVTSEVDLGTTTDLNQAASTNPCLPNATVLKEESHACHGTQGIQSSESSASVSEALALELDQSWIKATLNSREGQTVIMNANIPRGNEFLRRFTVSEQIDFLSLYFRARLSAKGCASVDDTQGDSGSGEALSAAHNASPPNQPPMNPNVFEATALLLLKAFAEVKLPATLRSDPLFQKPPAPAVKYSEWETLRNGQALRGVFEKSGNRS